MGNSTIAAPSSFWDETGADPRRYLSFSEFVGITKTIIKPKVLAGHSRMDCRSRSSCHLDFEADRLGQTLLHHEVSPPLVYDAFDDEAEHFICLKKYDGVITHRLKDSFWARLTETVNDYPHIEAEFGFSELSDSDREIANEGAPVVWTIGYALDGGTRKRQSIIYVRRIVAATSKEIEAAAQDLNELASSISWE